MSTEDRRLQIEALKRRTRKFGLSVFELYKTMRDTDAKFVYGKQLLRCSSSVGANYRSACRARSKADFINKLKTVEEEADESLHWIEFLLEAGELDKSISQPILDEGNQILSIVVASLAKTRGFPIASQNEAQEANS